MATTTTITKKRKPWMKTNCPRCVAHLFLLLFCLAHLSFEQDDLAEIDPTAIKSRRTRGKRVDYTSPEALAKAGLKPEAEEEDEE